MCTDTPMRFKRGSTFSVMFQIPEKVADGYLSGWLPTAQLRKAGNSGRSGLIAEMECYWDSEETARKLLVRNLMTEDWPLGLAELDIRLTSPSGETIQTKTINIEINRGITR